MRLGHQVTYLQDQACCGQMHLNSGYREEGLRLAKRFVQTYERVDAIVSPSASCVGANRHLYPSSAVAIGDTGLANDFNQATKSVYEFSQFLVDVLRVTDVGATFPHKVAYHPTCHSLRVMKILDQPISLLEHVKGLELMPFPKNDSCCGFGGTFSLKNSSISTAMGFDKLSGISTSKAEIVCAIDNSCLMHIQELSTKMKAGIKTM